MANKMHVSTEWLEKCARDLQQVSDSISSASGTLSGIHLRRDEGGNLKVSISCGLKMTGGHFSGSSAADDIRALQQASKALATAAAGFGRKASQAATIFATAENEAIRLLGGLNGGTVTDVYEEGSSGAGGAGSGSGGGGGTGEGDQPMIPAVIIALGYPSNTALWTKEMWDNYNDFLKDGVMYRDADGFTYIVSGETTIIAAPNGNVAVAESKMLEQGYKIYNKDGSYAEEGVELGFSSKAGEWKEKRPDLGNPDTYNSTGDPNYKGPSREKTLFEVKAEASGSVSAFHKDASYEDKYTSVSANVDVSKLSYNASISGGLYKTKVDKNGNTVNVLEPGIAAELGASYSAFEASASGRYGNEYVGVDAGVSTKVLSGSLKADAELGIVDGHVAAHAGASAEGILVEAKGEVGVDVLGTEVKAVGTVNIGIGAHADIGVHDGKISCDIGASLGVGASVKVELDYAKTAENIVNGAKDLYSGAKKGAVNAWKGISKAFKW